jgi:outer membrane murein-binding lipoprotein Lpp
MLRGGNSKGDCKMSGLKFPQCAMMMFAAMLGLAGCVTQQKYDALEARYRQLNQTMSTEISANQMQITRLQNAIKVTVNSELLFPLGDWQMPVEAQQTISKIVPILAPIMGGTACYNRLRSPYWPLVAPQYDSEVLERHCPPGLRCVCLAQTQLGWSTL